MAPQILLRAAFLKRIQNGVVVGETIRIVEVVAFAESVV